MTQHWLEVATANVLTLSPAEMPRKQQFRAQGFACTERAEVLQRAFHSDGLHIVVCKKHEFVPVDALPGEYYDVLSSAATDQGSHGVQL